MKKERFILFSNCLLVKGHNRSLIADLQRGRHHVIPNTMQEIILELSTTSSINDLLSSYDIENSKIIKEYLDYLQENELGFFVDENELKLFPQLSTEYHIPQEVSNSIIELSDRNLFFLEDITKQLDHLNCKYLQLISYSELSKESIVEILKITNNSNFRSIELLLKYSPGYDLDFIKSLDKYNFRITSLTLHSSIIEEEYDYKEVSHFYIKYIKESIVNFNLCGQVDAKYFNVNYDKVLESLNHNSCLHKKISIDIEGNIKNCPSMVKSFGQINNTRLKEALNKEAFKKYWDINKDKIEVCKDCEFRHVCTDCRAFVEEPDNQYSKPLKCGYSPYTNVWEEWSTNPLKQKSILYYELSDLVKKDA